MIFEKCEFLLSFDLLFLGIFHVLELNSVWKLPFQKVSFYKPIFWREISNVGRDSSIHHFDYCEIIYLVFCVYFC